MKKKIISLLLCLVLVLAIGISSANADNNIYTSLGTASAGSYIDCLILSYGEGTPTWNSYQLPDGTWIESEYNGAGYSLYLRGTAYWAGSYDFTIEILNSDESLTVVNCTISILPSDVSFSYISDVETNIGASVILQAYASIADYGNLSLQWYRYENGYEYALPGETGSTLYVSCDNMGAYYYFCRGTNMNNGLERTSDSRIITVHVADPVVTSISIETMPQKLSFVAGDYLDTSGLALLVQYNTGAVDYITSGFSVYPDVLSQAGYTNITVSYMGVSCSYQVNVKSLEETINGIGLSAYPQKTTYTVGESLNTYGMAVRVYSSVKNYDITSGFSCSPVNFTSAGTQTITVSYKGFSCTFTVYVEAPAAETISVSVLPKKLSYKVGEQLDTTGLVVAISQGQQRREIITGFTCTPNTFSKEGSQEVTVSYNGKTCSFYVTVLPDYSSTPVVTPTPAPQSGSSSQNGQSSQQGGSSQGSSSQGGQSTSGGTASGATGSTTNHSSNGSSTTQRENSGISILVIILVISVAALIGLCVYVYIMQHEKVLDFIESLFNRDRD